MDINERVEKRYDDWLKKQGQLYRSDVSGVWTIKSSTCNVYTTHTPSPDDDNWKSNAKLLLT